MLSIESSCLAIDLCHSSLMNADQKPILKLTCQTGLGGAEIDGGQREQETARQREREIVFLIIDSK